MKFYNPFKWHIVQFENGKYGLRKYSMFSWDYKELPEYGQWTWFLPEHVIKYCMFDSLTEVLQLKEELTPKKIKVQKVHG